MHFDAGPPLPSGSSGPEPPQPSALREEMALAGITKHDAGSTL